MGRPVFAAPADAVLAVEGRAERLVDGWRAVLRVADRDGAVLGERTVESHAPTCDELGRAVTVTLALLLEPLAAPAAAPPPPARPRWQVEVDGAIFAAAGLVPGVGVGGLGAVYLTPPGFVAVLAQGGVAPFARAEGAGASADLLRVEGGLAICPLDLHRDAWVVRGCVGLDAGAAFVLAATTAMAERERVLVQAHGVLSVHWAVAGPLVVRAGLHPVVPFRAFAVGPADGEPWWEAPPFAAYLDVGVGLHF